MDVLGCGFLHLEEHKSAHFWDIKNVLSSYWHTEFLPFEKGSTKRASILDVAPSWVYGQIDAILHRVCKTGQICPGNPVPCPCDFPAESSNVHRAVWQLVDLILQIAPQVLNWVQIGTHGRPLHRRDVVLTQECLCDLTNVQCLSVVASPLALVRRKKAAKFERPFVPMSVNILARNCSQTTRESRALCRHQNQENPTAGKNLAVGFLR